MRVLSVLLLLACATFAPAQTVKLPEIVAGEPATFLQVSAKTDCASLKWFTPDTGLAIFPTDLLKSTLTAVVTSAKPGKYRLYAYGAKDGQASDVALCVIVVGEPPAPPPPPPPPVPPDPPKPPVPTPGARLVLLVRETAAATPELRQAIIALRAGAHAEYLKSKGHTLTILDDDAVGPDGKPSVAVKWWWEHYKDVKLPALVIGTTNRDVLSVTPLPDKVTADEIIAILKKAGG